MNRIIFSIMTLAIISLLLGMAGVQTTGWQLLNSLGITVANDYAIENVQSGSFWSTFFSSSVGLILTALGLVTIGIGLVTRTITKIPIAITGVAFLVVFISDFISIYAVARNYGVISQYVSVLLLVPLIINYLFGVIEWFFTIN